jgi:hypothetical protein
LKEVAVMVYVTLTEYDVDLDAHIAMGKAVGEGPVEGLVLHLAGPSDRGVHSLDIWQTREDSVRFWSEVMGPGLKEMGIEGGPPLSYQAYELPYGVEG